MTERLKLWLRRFRLWKKKPVYYNHEQKEPVQCANCGHTFADNFCPRCGQRAGVGRVGWHTVRDNIMLLWGMDSRSMPYSLLQLLGRPGYLINDYINGRQKISFPPVKMLFIIAIILVLLKQLFPDAPMVEVQSDGEELLLMKMYSERFNKNPALGLLLLNIFFLLPTWLLFRYAPRNSRHTLPQGFFIQVFMSIIIIIFDCIGQVVGNSVEWFMPLYYIITFHQLFGYSLWGTTWRIIFCLLQTLFLVIIVAILFDLIVKGKPSTPDHPLYQELIGIIVILLFNVILIIPLTFIGKFTEKRRKKKESR